VLTAPRSPWQDPCAERLAGALRRACLGRVIVLGGSQLHGISKSYFADYRQARTHLSLGQDAPEPRAVQPPSMADIVEPSEVDGLHHRYERRAARPALALLVLGANGEACPVGD
jgi:putative transposase